MGEGYGWCSRNAPVPAGTKISTDWRLQLWIGEWNSPGHDSWVDQWLAQMFVTLCASKRRPFWVTTMEMSFWKYFFNFLKILYRYRLYLHQKKFEIWTEFLAIPGISHRKFNILYCQTPGSPLNDYAPSFISFPKKECFTVFCFFFFKYCPILKK